MYQQLAGTGDREEVNILLLGDSEVGKSLFLSRLTVLKSGPRVAQLPTLRDFEQPFIFDVTVFRKSIRLQFQDTASPTNYLLTQPAVLVLCFSIDNRSSLRSLRTNWKDTVEQHFNYNDQIPVIVLGLKRDLRKENDPGSIFPHEGATIAQDMRCDKYCECSALTGELMDLVFKDIAETAALTTTEEGGRTPGPSCEIM
ncbi:P-loop containing nucleoside triphosphate hydrolase protein [Myriangium duriaei CBS 260.36]|uniref:P-loop containing nucleoside triphosphate hydrolase protein n=1 Tax=Myriangium duriaei CBS 260.36 TaxID=1168546 RepID=A0A9P4IYY8_9PEZI|nr:P-loop containing nucleoside triphosphate hydrolase protein [Myriangium duriaei CBS 260.36]